MITNGLKHIQTLLLCMLVSIKASFQPQKSCRDFMW